MDVHFLDQQQHLLDKIQAIYNRRRPAHKGSPDSVAEPPPTFGAGASVPTATQAALHTVVFPFVEAFN